MCYCCCAGESCRRGLGAVVSALVAASPSKQLSFRVQRVTTCQLAALTAMLNFLWPGEDKPVVCNGADVEELVGEGLLFSGERPFLELYNDRVTIQHLEHVDHTTQRLLFELGKEALATCGCKLFEGKPRLQKLFAEALRELAPSDKGSCR